MSAIIRIWLIVLAAGIAPALAQNAEAPVARAASTVDTTPPGSLNPKPRPPLTLAGRPATSVPHGGDGALTAKAQASEIARLATPPL